MRKRKHGAPPRTDPYTEQQLAGLREYAQLQKQQTLSRLEAAIASLTAQHKPISARTIREECGLEYASLRRNPEALLLYQQQSTFLKQKRKQTKAPKPDALKPRDPLLAYKKTDLVARVHTGEALLKARDEQHGRLLQDYAEKDTKIAELEAELARYRTYFEGLRLRVQSLEHQGEAL